MPDDRHGKAALHEVGGHRLPHGAEADECDTRRFHCALLRAFDGAAFGFTPRAKLARAGRGRRVLGLQRAPQPRQRERRVPAVDDDLAAGDVARLVRGEEEHRLRHLVGAREATVRDHPGVGFRMSGRGAVGDARVADLRGVDRVGADAPVEELQRRRLGDAAQAPLAADVRDPGVSDESCRRRDVDDRAAAGVAHQGRARAHAEERAGQVDVQHAGPLAAARVHDAAPADDAGVVDEHVQRPERPADARDDPRPAGLARHVEFQHGHTAAAAFGFLRDGRRGTEHDVGEDHGRAFGGEELRIGRALPAAASGDQGHLALEPSTPHYRSSCCFPGCFPILWEAILLCGKHMPRFATCPPRSCERPARRIAVRRGDLSRCRAALC